MTEQEIFDLVSVKLVEQGCASTNKSGCCQYRGQHGRKCAVGWLIEDSEYKTFFEGTNVIGLRDSGLLPARLDEHVAMLMRLQCAHDGPLFSGLYPWSVQMRAIARDRGLSTAALDNAIAEREKGGA